MSKVYQYVTDRIIERLDQGDIPWRKPWQASQVEPQNFISKKPYRGINRFLLSHVASPYFLTFKQAKSLGGQVRKGEKSQIVVFWKQLQKNNGKKNKKGEAVIDFIPLLRYYRVFSLNQIDGIEIPKNDAIELKPNEKIDRCESIVKQNNPTLLHQGGQAFYSPSQDSITMPEIETFDDSESYYATLFHEMIHWTGHKDRLNRDKKTDSSFGSRDYAKEELVAEMGSAFLCAKTQIDLPKIQENEVAYIQNWLKVLRSNGRLVVEAASKAQKAADFINKVEA